jgi:PAS domain S-box-containing protein
LLGDRPAPNRRCFIERGARQKATYVTNIRGTQASTLHTLEQRFHHLVDAVTDYAIFMLDTSGNVASWNSGAQKTKGYTADEIIGQHFSVFYTPEDRASGKPERILDTVRREGRYEEEGWRVRESDARPHRAARRRRQRARARA